MKSAFVGLGLVLAGVAVFAACGGDDSKGGAATTVPATAPGATVAATKGAAPTNTAKPAAQGTVPADACALLTLDEVHQVGPTAGAGTQDPQRAAPGVTVVACRWEWPENMGGSLVLTITTLPDGTPADVVKSSLRSQVKDNGRELSGIGDFAIVISTVKLDVTARALVNGLLVDLNLNVLGARDKEAQMEALLKAIAGRM